MPQFDVFQLHGSGVYPLVVDVQNPLHSRLSSRIVIPMTLRSRYTQPTTNLTPVLGLDDGEYVVLTPLLASVPKASLGKVVGSLAAHRWAFITALDLLITGS
jgi:toxin CcdB